MKTIGWGIIGCGDVCEKKSGPAFYKCQNSSLQAVMRRNEEKAADFAKRHDVPRYYTDADCLISDPNVDIVYIATPPSTYADLTVKALRAGKPVYVEKPMAINYEQCCWMNQVAEEYNQKIWVAYYRRSLPYFLKVKELILGGIIGKVEVVHVTFFRPPLPADTDDQFYSWRTNKQIAGGGYFYDMASHTIDILQYLVGNIIKVKGIVGNVGGIYEVEDTVSASFHFDTGVIGSGIWNYTSSQEAAEDQIEIFGDKGIIKFSTFDMSTIEIKTKSKTEKFCFTRPAHIQQNLIQSIINEILGIGKCPSTGHSAALTNWVIGQIFN